VKPHRYALATPAVAAVALMLVAAPPAPAQEYGVYLACKGLVHVEGGQHPAHVDLALRRNSQVAMIQSSDVLPAGERLKLEITPSHYTIHVAAPTRGVIYQDWLRGAVIVWSPDLQRLRVVRLSVDRQSGALEGNMLDGAGRLLGTLAMQCEATDNQTAPKPKL